AARGRAVEPTPLVERSAGRPGCRRRRRLMKLTRASSYALHAVAYMAAQKKADPVASHVIAQDRGIPERFLLKVLKPLVSAQILLSIKGPNGGYRPAPAAHDITILEVAQAVDRPLPRHPPL